MFRKPLSTSFKFNLSNSVSLVGFVDQPISVIDTEPDRFGVSTWLRVKDPRDPNRSFRSGLFDSAQLTKIRLRIDREFDSMTGYLLVSGT